MVEPFEKISKIFIEERRMCLKKAKKGGFSVIEANVDYATATELQAELTR